MKFFDKHYKDLRKQRSYIDNDGLGKTYKRVIDEYNHCLEQEEYIVSFILVQNLLEDRLYVLYRLMDIEEHTKKGWRYNLTIGHYHQNVDLKRVVYRLHEYGLLTDELKRNLLTSCDLRNRHIHFSFMDIDSFDKDLSEGFFHLFREVDKVIQKFKKMEI